jgi:alpha-glucosidase (family GH31 glycosyl hydrolase)
MVPINYDDRLSWNVLTNAIIDPKSAEGRQWWEEIRNYKKGLTNEKQQGYQYDNGEFPYIFKSVNRPRPKK